MNLSQRVGLLLSGTVAFNLWSPAWAKDKDATTTGPTVPVHEAPTQSWPEPPKAPAGAPNVVWILIDDVGFGATSGWRSCCRGRGAGRVQSVRQGQPRLLRGQRRQRPLRSTARQVDAPGWTGTHPVERTPDSPRAPIASSAQPFGPRGPVAGDVKLSISGAPVGESHFSGIYGSGETLDVGSDLG
jgi:hypothetical protein